MSPAEADGTIDLAIEGAVATITLRRPHKLNALSRSMGRQLEAVLDQLDHNEDVGVVMLAGEGRAFCVGADLTEVGALAGAPEAFRYLRRMQQAITRFRDVRVPTIGVLHGAVLGGGLELALACDLRVASSSCKLGLPEITIGALPGAGGLDALAREIGVARAKWLVLTGRNWSADEGLSAGLVHVIAPSDDEARALAVDLARELAERSGLALSVAKQILNSVEPRRGVYDALGSALTFGDPEHRPPESGKPPPGNGNRG